MRSIRIILSGLFIMVHGSLFAQAHGGNLDPSSLPEDGSINGTIIDKETGQPVEYASIAVYRMRDTILVDGTISGQDGSFIMSDMPYGMYIIEVRFVGYRNLKLNRVPVLPGNKSVNLGEVPLEQSAAEIDQVEVVGQKAAVEYHIDKKIVNVSSNVVASGGTAVDVLEMQPSIQTDLEGNVQLRGSSNFTVLIDGKPSILEGSDALQSLPASSIDHIEVITNPSAKYDPDGTSGIINVILKKQKMSGFSGLMNASYGSFNRYNLDVLLNYRVNQWNFYLGAEIYDRSSPGSMFNERRLYDLDAEGNIDTTTFRFTESDNERFRGGQSIRGGVELNLDPRNSFSLSTRIGNHNFGRNSSARYSSFTEPSSFTSYSLQESLFDIDHDFLRVDLTWSHQFNKPGHELVGMVLFSQHVGQEGDFLTERVTDEFFNPREMEPYRQQSEENDGSGEWRFKLDYTGKINGEMNVEAGWQTTMERNDPEYLFYDYDTINAAWLLNGDRSNENEFNWDIHAVYGTIAGKLLGLEYKFGLRGEYTDRKFTQLNLGKEYPVNRFDIFPSAYLTKKFQSDHQLQASYSRRINRPRSWYLDPFPHYIDQQTVRVGNPALEPEYVNSYELNYMKRSGRSYLSAELYVRETQNKIDRINALQEGGMLRYTVDNISSDRALGIEVSSNLHLARWWNIMGSMDIFNYRIDGTILHTEVDQATNTWGGRLMSNWNLKTGTRIQLMGFYRGPSVTSQGERDDFLMTNFGIRQDFFDRKLNLAFQVRDVLQTMKFSFTTEGADFYTFNKHERQSPFFTFTLTYRINNYKQKSRNGEGDTIEMEFDDGGVIY